MMFMIEGRMNSVQQMMENNIHLTDPDQVQAMINSITKFWSVMKEEDKDYLQAAQWALEEKSEWKIDD